MTYILQYIGKGGELHFCAVLEANPQEKISHLWAWFDNNITMGVGTKHTICQLGWNYGSCYLICQDQGKLIISVHI